MPTTVTGRHYARPSDEAQRAAVDGLPVIDLLGPARKDNVVPLASSAGKN